ncbi:MAG TPA: Ig-like domain-containing protein [Anaeromyxobacter sp.]|nr:Ig-like domain-containing protein [Anaeromyxobacter sp.]
MRTLAAAAALLLASCQDPGGQCAADADCLPEQVCGPDALCVPGARPPPGGAPVALDDTYVFAGAGPFVVAAPGVLGNDEYTGSGTLQIVVVDRPAAGSLLWSREDGSFTYVPFTGFTGADGFTYRATDGTMTSDVASVSITVNP